MWDPYAEFESAALPNGLTVYAAHWPGRSWEAMGFMIHSGAEQDPIGLEGLAHFVEHLVSCNAKIPPQLLRAFFEGRGGSADLGMTSYFYTRYRFFAPTNREFLKKALSNFGHMLFLAKLENFVERQREIIIAEFNRRYPAKLALDLTLRERRALFSGDRIERFVRALGTPESVARGRELYTMTCLVCHGPEGRGDGPVGLPFEPVEFVPSTFYLLALSPVLIEQASEPGIPLERRAELAIEQVTKIFYVLDKITATITPTWRRISGSGSGSRWP